MEAKSHPLIERLIDLTETSGGEAVETSRDVLHKLSGKDNPQTVLGVYDELTTPLDSIDRSRADIWFVAQSLRDPGNLGTILRTGDAVGAGGIILVDERSEEHTSELQSLMRISYAVFCLKKKTNQQITDN